MSNEDARQRVYNVDGGQLNQEERLDLLKLLARAGYSVRIGREKPQDKPNGAYIYFVEYWREN